MRKVASTVERSLLPATFALNYIILTRSADA